MPYNPGVVDRSGEILAGGMSRGIDGIMAGFEKMKAEQKRVLDGGKIADSIVKTYPDILESLGMPAESFQALGAKEKALRVQGAIMGAGYKKAQQDMELQAQRIAALKQDQNEENAQGQAIQSFFQGPDRTPRGMDGLMNPVPSAPAPDVDYLERMRGAFQTPGLGGRGTINLLQALERLDPSRGKNLNQDLRVSEVDPNFVIGPNGYVMKRNTGKTGDLIPTQEDNVFVNPNTGATIDLRNKKGETSAVQPWELSQNDDEWLKGLQNLSDDPKAFEAALARRHKIKLGTNGGNLKDDLMLWMMNGGTAKEFFAMQAAKTGKGPDRAGRATGGTGAAGAGSPVRKWNPKTRRFE